MSDLLWILKDYWSLLLVGAYPRGPLGGMSMTLLLSVLSLVLAFACSVPLALLHAHGSRRWRRAVAVWVAVIRGVPLVMLIFWVYFLVPLLIGHNISGFATMLCTLVIYESAYLSEIIRGGIEALPSGQQEAGRALGMNYLQCQRWLVLPQALYNTLPSLLNQFVSIIKETSLGYVINLQEFTFAANQVNGQVLTRPFQIFFILAIGYFVVCHSLGLLAKRVERRIQLKHAGQSSVPSKPEPVQP